MIFERSKSKRGFLGLMALVLVLGTTSAWSATTIEMRVNGLVCSFCAQGVEKALRQSPATDEILVSLESGLVAVSLKEGQDISDFLLKQQMTDAGYEVRSISRTSTPIAVLRQQVGQKKD
jgi:copper chaperone CopZ